MSSLFKIDASLWMLIAISIFALTPLLFQNNKIRTGILFSFIAVLGSFWFQNIISLKYPAILLLGISGLLIYIIHNVKNRIAWSALYIINFAIIYTIFASYIIPFERLELVSAKLSILSGEYSIMLNLSKVILGYLLVYYFISKKDEVIITRKLHISTFAKYYIFSAILLIGVAFSLGYLKFDPKLPTVIPLWVFTMLFFVCIPEEIFYRRYILKQLDSLNKSAIWKNIALIISSIIFGIAHYNKGISFVILSIIAGLFYGRIYQKTGSISHAVYLHFMINFTHFIFFTYP